MIVGDFCSCSTAEHFAKCYFSKCEITSFQALKQLPREKIQLATKFGIVGMKSTEVIVNGTPEYVRSCCEGSLKRLGVEYIDLYYQHRIDTSVPIEDTVRVRKLPSPFLNAFCIGHQF